MLGVEEVGVGAEEEVGAAEVGVGVEEVGVEERDLILPKQRRLSREGRWR